jgi:hypothetical protein
MSKRQIRIQERVESAKKARRFVREEARSAADRLATLSVSSPIPSVRANARQALAALSRIAKCEIDAARLAGVMADLEAISCATDLLR